MAQRPPQTVRKRQRHQDRLIHKHRDAERSRDRELGRDEPAEHRGREREKRETDTETKRGRHLRKQRTETREKRTETQGQRCRENAVFKPCYWYYFLGLDDDLEVMFVESLYFYRNTEIAMDEIIYNVQDLLQNPTERGKSRCNEMVTNQVNW